MVEKTFPEEWKHINAHSYKLGFVTLSYRYKMNMSMYSVHLWYFKAIFKQFDMQVFT